jgi:hypothetical protein
MLAKTTKSNLDGNVRSAQQCAGSDGRPDGSYGASDGLSDAMLTQLIHKNVGIAMSNRTRLCSMGTFAGGGCG